MDRGYACVDAQLGKSKKIWTMQAAVTSRVLQEYLSDGHGSERLKDLRRCGKWGCFITLPLTSITNSVHLWFAKRNEPNGIQY